MMRYFLKLNLMLCVLWAINVNAAEYFVDGDVITPATNCTDALSEATAHDTIAECIACLSAGDTCTILETTSPYDESIDGDTVPSGVSSYSTATTIRGKLGETPVLQPTSGSLSVIQFDNTVIKNWIIVQNIRVVGTSLPNGVRCVQMLNGSSIDRLEDIRFDGIQCYDFDSDAIVVGDFTDRIEFINGLIDRVTSNNSGNCTEDLSPGFHAFYWRSKNGLIANNVAHCIAGNFIQIRKSTTADLTGNTIIGNHGEDIAQHGVFLQGQADSTDIFKNTFRNVVRRCFWNGNSTGSRLYGNICGDLGTWTSSNFCILDTGTERLDQANNILKNCTGGYGTSHSSNAEDPADSDFINWSTGDWRQSSTSTLTDNGITVSGAYNCNGTCDQGPYEITNHSDAVVETPTPNVITVTWESGVSPFTASNGCTGWSFANITCTPSCNSVVPDTLNNTIDITLSCNVVSTDTGIQYTYNGTHIESSDNIGGPLRTLVLPTSLGAFANQRIFPQSNESVTNNVMTPPALVNMQGYIIKGGKCCRP